jgi:transposase
VLARKTLACTQTQEIVEFFRPFRPFQVVVEATTSYPWFVDLVEPLAERVVLANPKKLRVIAESTKKTDRLDAQILAEFLVRDMIPESYQPTPRQRQHRALVRHRQYLQGRITSVRSKIRHILSNSNADRKDLFSAQGGPAYFQELPLSDADRFVLKQLWAEWQDHVAQRLAASKKLKAFVAKAPHREAEARAILKTAPGVGFVTAEVILSELADISRFRSAKRVCAYAGLVPLVRQSGEKRSKDLKITKQGSGLLRWALVEAAWRLVRTSLKWGALFARLRHRSGQKRAIVAVARKLLCVLYAMLKTSTPYKIIIAQTPAPQTPRKKLVRISRKAQTPTAETTAPAQTPTAETTAPAQTPTPEPAASAQTPTAETTAPQTTRKKSTKAATPEQTTTAETTAPRTTRNKLTKAATPEQTTTAETAAPQTTRKKLTKAATPEQTTTAETTAPRTTRNKLTKAATPKQTTTTETSAPRTTRKKLTTTPAPNQTTTR